MSDEETPTEPEARSTTRPIDALPIDIAYINMCYEGIRVCRELITSNEVSSGIRSKARDLAENILARLDDIFARPGT